MKKIITNLGFLCIAGCAIAQNPHYAWAKQTTGDAGAAGIGCVAVDTINQYVYTVGSFSSGQIDFGSGQLDGSSGSNSVFLAKYNLSGSLIWAKSFPSYHDNDATGIAVDRSGNLFVAGYSQDDTVRFGNQYLLNSHPTSTDHTVGYVAKLDANGNITWLKGSTGGGGVIVNAVSLDAAGNAFITGNVVDNTGTFLGHTMTVGGYIMKISSSGNSVWFTQILPSGLLVSNGNSIAADHSGNCIVVGTYADDITLGPLSLSYASGNGTTDRFAAKLDGSTGDFMWAVGNGVWEGPDGNVDVSVDALNNIYITGYESIDTEGTGSSAYDKGQFIEKMDSTGGSYWHNAYGNAVPVGPTSIVSDNAGNSYVTYNIYDTTTYGAFTIDTHTPFMFESIVTAVVKVDNAGNVLFAKGTNDPVTGSWASCIGIVMDTHGYLYTTGTLNYTCDFDGTLLDAGNSGTEVTLAKLGSSVTAGIDEQAKAPTVSVFPNPANNVLYVDHLNGKAKFSMADLQGRIILSGNASSADNRIDISAVPAGIYMLELISNGTAYHQKIIVEK